MGELHAVGDLEISQDIVFQRRAWKVQRVGWVILVLFVLAALLGLMGSGPLSQARAGHEQGTVWVEYSRFSRAEAETALAVHLGPAAMRDGKARVWLDRTYHEKIKIDRIMPEPLEVEAAADRLTYVFPVGDGAQPVAVVFHFQPRQAGVLHPSLGVPQADTLSFAQYVYP